MEERGEERGGWRREREDGRGRRVQDGDVVLWGIMMKWVVFSVAGQAEGSSS